MLSRVLQRSAPTARFTLPGFGTLHSNPILHSKALGSMGKSFFHAQSRGFAQQTPLQVAEHKGTAQAAVLLATKARGGGSLNGGRGVVNIALAVMGGVMLLPHFWIQVAQSYGNSKDDEDRNHGQANKWQENIRAARRGSLKEYKEAYFGKTDEHEYTAGAYWDRFNNNTITEQKHNPNMMKKKSSISKRPIGMYDTEGRADKTRTAEGNEWVKKRSQTYMKKTVTE